jgi:hypothetical protein
MLIVCMTKIKLSYIRLECKHRKQISLLYKLYYMGIVFIEKTISTLSSSSSGTIQLHRQSTEGNESI